MKLIFTTMLDVIYLSLRDETPAKGYWDQTFIGDLLDGLPDSDRKVFIIPGAYQADKIDEINMRLSSCKKILVFITSDEEKKFPIFDLKHPDMYLFSQYGALQNNLPLGYTPHTRDKLKEIGYIEKDIPWFYSGQINHIRRQLMQEVLVQYDVDHDKFLPSEGFSKGLAPFDYIGKMARAKAVPCPPGNLTQDSFRVYEALEAGAVPVVDRFSAQGDAEYWQNLFPNAPFPIFSTYYAMIPALERAQDPVLRNRVFAWWIKEKMLLRQKIKEILNINEAMTVIVPTSPIPSHPSTEIIDETIKSIRYHTAMDIIISIDGVREEQKDQYPQYQEYVRRLLWKCNFEYKNVMPVLFESHEHQSGMMQKVLPLVKTPLIMYVEHDTPLVTDEEIDWGLISQTILKGKAHAVRLHFEAHVPKEHEYLMVHDKDIPLFAATKQWSQRPHIARTDFYREIMKFFSFKANCFIEDLIYGRCVEGNWEDWKLFIYNPGENIKRSLNLDGRGSDRKFEKEQQW